MDNKIVKISTRNTALDCSWSSFKGMCERVNFVLEETEIESFAETIFWLLRLNIYGQ